jgi:hypothetical protein
VTRLKHGVPAEMRSRVLVWTIPGDDFGEGDIIPEIGDEIRRFLPDFSFHEIRSDEVCYMFDGGKEFWVDRGSSLVLDLGRMRLHRASERYVLSMLSGVGL